MRCPLLNGRYTKQCGAVKAIVVLSKAQLELYCESVHYEQCPIYKTWNTGKDMTLGEYCRINQEVVEIQH